LIDESPDGFPEWAEKFLNLIECNEFVNGQKFLEVIELREADHAPSIFLINFCNFLPTNP
jgi:hypothetical protein